MNSVILWEQCRRKFYCDVVCPKYVLLAVYWGEKSEAWFYIRHRFPNKRLGIPDESLLGEETDMQPPTDNECLKRESELSGEKSEHFHLSDINVHSH